MRTRRHMFRMNSAVPATWPVIGARAGADRSIPSLLGRQTLRQLVQVPHDLVLASSAITNPAKYCPPCAQASGLRAFIVGSDSCTAELKLTGRSFRTTIGGCRGMVVSLSWPAQTARLPTPERRLLACAPHCG